MHYLSLVVPLLTTPLLAATWTLTEVDSSPYTGAENAIYAPDVDTVYIAYKQFLEPPSSDYTPAAVKLAQSIDGRQSWQLSIIDLDAAQSVALLEQSVSISHSPDTLYAAYVVHRLSP